MNLKGGLMLSKIKYNFYANKRNQILFLGILILFSSSCSLLNSNLKNPCIEKQVALDIGSGSSKILAAEMNTCEGKIIKVLFKESKAIKVKESLVNNLIPDPIVAQLDIAFSDWLTKLKPLKIQTFKGIATEVFRSSTNGNFVISELEKKHQIKIKIITQVEESILGFWSAVGASRLDPKNVISWDIGGGSMQMTTLNDNNEFIFYNGKMASVSFKNEYLKTTKCRNNTNCSPNPMGLKGVLSAVKIADLYAKKNVPIEFKKEFKLKTVIGIGGVHSKSIWNQLLRSQPNETELNLNNLQTLVFENAKLSDQDLKSDYAETEVTNIALVLGFMKRLEIQSVKPFDVDLTTGILVQKN